MEHLQLAQILATRATLAHAGSALPNAPVVPYRERPSCALRTRDRLAGLLRRAAGGSDTGSTLIAPTPRFS